jgi:hypothetical protein
MENVRIFWPLGSDQILVYIHTYIWTATSVLYSKYVCNTLSKSLSAEIKINKIETRSLSRPLLFASATNSAKLQVSSFLIHSVSLQNRDIFCSFIHTEASLSISFQKGHRLLCTYQRAVF